MGISNMVKTRSVTVEQELHWSSLLVLVPECIRLQMLGGSGGIPPGKLFKFDTVRGYFGAQNITTNLCYSPGMVTVF